MKTGKQNKLKLIDVEKVVSKIDYENEAGVCKGLLGLRAFTGCDTTSAFHSRGKVKALRVMLKHNSVETFGLLGQNSEWEVSQQLFDELQVISYLFIFLHSCIIHSYITESKITKLARRN